MRIESGVFAVSLALVVAHPQLESSQGRPRPLLRTVNNKEGASSLSVCRSRWGRRGKADGRES